MNATIMKQQLLVLPVILCTIHFAPARVSASTKAETILATADVKGGIVVVLGCDDPELLTGFVPRRKCHWST